MIKIILFVIVFITIVSASTVTCGIKPQNHTIQLISTSQCLSSEDTLFVDGFFVNCNPRFDQYALYAMSIIGAVCENPSLEFVAGIPNTHIICNGHDIVFQATNLCLYNEYGVFVDNVNFLCVEQNDKYLFTLTQTIQSICGGKSIVVTN